jgi:hypothetical protein
METYEDKINAMKDKISKIEKIVSKMQKQQVFLDHYLPLASTEPGIERQVRYDATTIWANFSFIEGAIAYHAENYIYHANRVLEMLNTLPLMEDVHEFGIEKNVVNKMSYELDSFVIKFSQAIEHQTIQDIEKVAKGSAKAIFEKLRYCISRNNVDGFYWRINLLRNQAAHSPDARYSDSEEQPQRFLESSSENRGICIVEPDALVLQCPTLVDLKRSPKFKAIISSEIIEKNSKTPIWDIILPKKSAKGRGKDKPYQVLLIDLFEPFDLFGSFCELIYDVADYLFNINLLFWGTIENHTSEMNQTLVYGQNADGTKLTVTKEIFG